MPLLEIAITTNLPETLVRRAGTLLTQQIAFAKLRDGKDVLILASVDLFHMNSLFRKLYGFQY